MSVAPYSNTGQSIKFESVTISVSYADLSTFCRAANTAAVSGLLNEPQPISARARLRRAWFLHPPTRGKIIHHRGHREHREIVFETLCDLCDLCDLCVLCGENNLSIGRASAARPYAGLGAIS